MSAPASLRPFATPIDRGARVYNAVTEDAIGYAAEGASSFGVQYDPAKFPLSKELKELGLSEQAWAAILTSLRQGKGKTGFGFGFSKAIAR